mgnify:CR=1 FL=1
MQGVGHNDWGLGRLSCRVKPSRCRAQPPLRRGDSDHIRERGLDAFRQDIAAIAPFLADRTGDIASWDDVKLLTVQVNRLPQWHRKGLLCIGDAAHEIGRAHV